MDINYQGGGIGEYMYWDPNYNRWSAAACDEMKNAAKSNDGYNSQNYNSQQNKKQRFRCAKMDCHTQGSDNFRLLGFFKAPNFAEFFEQLFYHQAACLWDDDQYKFMQKMRQLWPQGCTDSGVYDDSLGSYLYLDLRPLEGADVTVGLYVDSRCSVDYEGKYGVVDVLDAYAGNDRNRKRRLNEAGEGEGGGGGAEDEEEGDNANANANWNTNNYPEPKYISDLVNYADYWNSGMSLFKQCQPCKAYDLNYEYVEYEINKNDDYYKSVYGHYWYYFKNAGEPNDDHYADAYNQYYKNYATYMKQQEGGYGEYVTVDDDSKNHFTCQDPTGGL